jgi:hypothetical protein
MSSPQTRRSQAVTAARLRDRTHITSAANPITATNLLQRAASTVRVRVTNQINEHRLRRASRAYLAAARCGDRSAQVAAWARYGALHAKRSPACIARLEARLGTRMRRTIKRNLMTAFLHGALPKRCVVAAFRLFGLREA